MEHIKYKYGSSPMSFTGNIFVEKACKIFQDYFDEHIRLKNNIKVFMMPFKQRNKHKTQKLKIKFYFKARFEEYHAEIELKTE
jgi:hypothetical protein